MQEIKEMTWWILGYIIIGILFTLLGKICEMGKMPIICWLIFIGMWPIMLLGLIIYILCEIEI